MPNMSPLIGSIAVNRLIVSAVGRKMEKKKVIDALIDGEDDGEKGGDIDRYIDR